MYIEATFYFWCYIEVNQDSTQWRKLLSDTLVLTWKQSTVFEMQLYNVWRRDSGGINDLWNATRQLSWSQSPNLELIAAY